MYLGGGSVSGQSPSVVGSKMRGVASDEPGAPELADRDTVTAHPAVAPSPSTRTQVRRAAERAHYGRETIEAIIDAAWHCHIAFVSGASVHCIPTACWREGDHLYVHGSNGSRLLKALAEGTQVSVCVTHLDGLVLARSAFHHSMNYRSVVIYGHFDRVPDDAKGQVSNSFIQRVGIGREYEVRPPHPTELAATTILRISIAEAAAKIRSGDPIDDEADLALPVWAGVLPMQNKKLCPVTAPGCEAQMPSYIRGWSAEV